jgi:hypothetical protein
MSSIGLAGPLLTVPSAFFRQLGPPPGLDGTAFDGFSFLSRGKLGWAAELDAFGHSRRPWGKFIQAGL